MGMGLAHLQGTLPPRLLHHLRARGRAPLLRRRPHLLGEDRRHDRRAGAHRVPAHHGLPERLHPPGARDVDGHEQGDPAQPHEGAGPSRARPLHLRRRRSSLERGGGESLRGAAGREARQKGRHGEEIRRSGTDPRRAGESPAEVTGGAGTRRLGQGHRREPHPAGRLLSP